MTEKELYDKIRTGVANEQNELKQRFWAKVQVNYDRLGKVIRIAVQFLDNVIDVNKYPLSEIEKITKANRKMILAILEIISMSGFFNI